MTKVKIYGAGSIGNHLAFACHNMGWEVLICDKDAEALKRTKGSIYPSRYGAWHEDIRLCLANDIPKEAFDIVIIGTPPDSHIDLALKTLQEKPPRLILIEKPLCTPDLRGAQELYELSAKVDTPVCVGYNHTLGMNTVQAEAILNAGEIGAPITMNAGFQEYWGGIFKAHPWLEGPHDTYLGFSDRGGGASGEHSHAINIWQHFAHVMGQGKIVEVSASLDFVENGKVKYDRICALHVRTENGFVGSIMQDVVTEPPKKALKIQGEKGYLEWEVNAGPDYDTVRWQHDVQTANEAVIRKRRPDDFRWEVEHLAALLEGRVKNSPISLERGLGTMMVIAAANLSSKRGQLVSINYGKGYIPEALKIG